VAQARVCEAESGGCGLWWVRGVLAATYKGAAVGTQHARRETQGGSMARPDSRSSPGRSGEGDDPDRWGPPVSGREREEGGAGRE
jgi:hypothetical protein